MMHKGTVALLRTVRNTAELVLAIDSRDSVIGRISTGWHYAKQQKGTFHNLAAAESLDDGSGVLDSVLYESFY
jgi:hypothetical protein